MRATVPTQALLEIVQPQAPEGVEIDVWDMSAPATGDTIDLAVMPYLTSPNILRNVDAERVAWVQSQSLGFDGVEAELPDGVGFSNAISIHEQSTAELALALILAAQRDLPRYVDQQQTQMWQPDFAPGLQGLTALVVGVGGVGTAIAELLRAFKVEVLRSASRARTDDAGPIGGPADLPHQVADADVIVLAAPLTKHTHGLVDADLLAQMKPGALVVNVGRGGLVDTNALIAAAKQGKVRAALDVVDPEPLPSVNPLWTCPGVIITPHVGGRTTSMVNRVASLVIRQLHHLANGEQLECIAISPTR